MSKIAIFEGVDNVGKSAVASMLSKETGVPVFRNEEFYSARCEDHKRGPEYEIEKMTLMLNLVETLDADIIFDRFHLSELIYGFVDRGYTNNDAWKIDERLADMGAVLVYLEPYDLGMSEMLHGSDLTFHAVSFDKMVPRSKMLKVTGTMLDAARVVDGVMLAWKML